MLAYNVPIIPVICPATRMKPLGCMTDALGSASAGFEVLQRQMGECAVMVEALQKSMDSADCSAGLPVSALMVGHVQLNYLVITTPLVPRLA